MDTAISYRARRLIAIAAAIIVLGLALVEALAPSLHRTSPRIEPDWSSLARVRIAPGR